MIEHGLKIPTEGAKVTSVIMALERPATQCMVTLHNDNALELRNLNHFMAILCKWFKDPLADCKAH